MNLCIFYTYKNVKKDENGWSQVENLINEYVYNLTVYRVRNFPCTYSINLFAFCLQEAI